MGRATPLQPGSSVLKGHGDVQKVLWNKSSLRCFQKLQAPLQVIQWKTQFHFIVHMWIIHGGLLPVFFGRP